MGAGGKQESLLKTDPQNEIFLVFGRLKDNYRGITAGSQRYIGLSLQVESCNETTVFEFKGHSNRVGPSTINMGCGNSKTTREGTKCCKGAGKAATQKAEDHSNAAGVLEGCNLSSPQRRVPQRSEASAIKTRIECKTARIEQLLLKAEQSQL